MNVPRQQLCDTAHRVIGDTAWHGLEISLWTETTEPCSCDQTVDESGTFAGSIYSLADPQSGCSTTVTAAMLRVQQKSA